MTVKVFTANRLRDGAVVYLGPGGGWHEALDGAAVASSRESEAALQAIAAVAVAARLVVAPYAIVVERAAAGLVPISRRERIRAHGPSVGLPAAGAPAHTLAGWSRDDVPL